eukprot:SAG31_NODE_555_length_14169_cov_19.798721_3_plen_137_part_00
MPCSRNVRLHRQHKKTWKCAVHKCPDAARDNKLFVKRTLIDLIMSWCTTCASYRFEVFLPKAASHHSTIYFSSPSGYQHSIRTPDGTHAGRKIRVTLPKRNTRVVDFDTDAGQNNSKFSERSSTPSEAPQPETYAW